MADRSITWRQRVENLTRALGRRPTMAELMLIVPLHNMTPAEVEEQRQSFARAGRPIGDPRFD